jgi:hypothetical protein
MRHQGNRSFASFVSKSSHLISQPNRSGSRAGMAVLALILLATGSAIARADNAVRAVRLSNVVGSVQILNGTETQFSQAYPNMPLMQGSTLKTGDDGRAEIQFEDGSVARLTPNSSAVLSELGRTSDGNTNTALDVLNGLAYVEMSGAANQRFVVHFGPNEVISPAPVKFRVNLDATPVELAVIDGTAHVSAGTDYSVDVRRNETIRFDGNDATRYFLTQGLDADSWDQWNIDRDQAMSQMAAQETREARGSANPNDPGWNDLDYYGNWYSAPGGGSFWSPAGAGAGWDPYGSGYWGYYGAGGGGYTWISGYPWGWLPYHCGAWNYYNSVGWGWSPGGGCGGGWAPVSGIGFAPPGYRRIPRPGRGGPVHGPIRGPGPGRTLIAVNRGQEATLITPKPGIAPKTVAINGQPARLLPKTSAPGNSFAGRPTSTAIAARPGFGSAGDFGARTAGNMPVYRPTSPAGGAGYRPTAPTAFAPRAGGQVSSAPAAHYSAPSASAGMSSHAGASASGGSSGGSTGGGHH